MGEGVPGLAKKSTKSRRKKARGEAKKVLAEKKVLKKEKAAAEGVEGKAEVEIDISSHILVPKHIKLSEEEARELERMIGDLKLLPKIRVDDPAIAKLKAKPGDVIKILRPDEPVPYYRIVVA
ncbi:MAG: DNA-directed RNA polymerase subunit RpoH/Rpb5 C-terminal domain-containing protein [Candidatus Methanodesulfokora sp.]